MRPRFMLAVTLAMGILNLTAFVNLQRFHRLFVAMLGVDIFVVAVSYLVRRVSTSLRPVFMEFSEYFHLN